VGGERFCSRCEGDSCDSKSGGGDSPKSGARSIDTVEEEKVDCGGMTLK